MRLIFPEPFTEAAVRIEAEQALDDDAFWQFCVENPDLRIEREPGGVIVISPPTGGETGYRNSDLNAQLQMWSRRDGRGFAFDSSTEFASPTGPCALPTPPG